MNTYPAPVRTLAASLRARTVRPLYAAVVLVSAYPAGVLPDALEPVLSALRAKWTRGSEASDRAKLLDALTGAGL